MQFNSAQFLVFFPVVITVYFIVPRKLRYLWLLISSYYFYMCWNAKYALLLLFSTMATWCGALAVDKAGKLGKNWLVRIVLIAVLCANLGILAYFKYANFLLDSLNQALALLSYSGHFPMIDVLLPVGISFYIFQAIGYLIDVYRKVLEPERDLLRYALFVSFFPQLVAGPIERATNLLPQIRSIEKLRLWDFQRIQRGALTMLYGFIIKVVIADRAAIVVNTVFSDYLAFSPVAYIVAIFLFTVQIYCDFAGYSTIAIGAAEIMGIRLMENFRSPYFARSIKDFWSRWHISLSTWFMDYLYIPLGGNRYGLAKKCRNLFIVFVVSGLWHGASWHFVAWGALHALLRVAEELLVPVRRRLCGRFDVNGEERFLCLIQRGFTFLLVSLAWVFFRAEDVPQALYMLGRVFSFSWLSDVFGQLMSRSIGLSRYELIFLLISILVLFLSDWLKEKRIAFLPWFAARPWIVRACMFLAGILFLLVFGVYGPGYSASTFIYFQF